MSRKVQLHLVSSPEMGRRDEDHIIRFPRKAREHFQFSNNRVVLGKGQYEIVLKVKKAYKEDVRKLVGMVQSGKLNDAEALCVGFVTSAIRRKITRKGGDNVWISNGVGQITIGADPEFGLINGRGVLQRGEDVVSHGGSFGSDGPGVEVRPPPDKDHLTVVNNIQKILLDPPQAAGKYEWKGGATYKDINRVYWFGGHIHLGRPAQVEKEHAPHIYQNIATVLDGLLALPMVLFDTPDPQLRRSGCKYGYGKAGQIRNNSPEQNRFEYRVLSGLWLVHPTLAKMAMGVAKCVTETAYSRLSDQDFDYEWANQPVSRKGLLKSFNMKGTREIANVINKGDPTLVTPEQIKAWKRQIRQLDLFDEYSAELEALMALATSPPKEFNLNLRDNWYEKQPLITKPNAQVRKALEAVEEK